MQPLGVRECGYSLGSTIMGTSSRLRKTGETIKKHKLWEAICQLVGEAELYPDSGGEVIPPGSIKAKQPSRQPFTFPFRLKEPPESFFSHPTRQNGSVPGSSACTSSSRHRLRPRLHSTSHTPPHTPSIQSRSAGAESALASAWARVISADFASSANPTAPRFERLSHLRLCHLQGCLLSPLPLSVAPAPPRSLRLRHSHVDPRRNVDMTSIPALSGRWNRCIDILFQLPGTVVVWLMCFPSQACLCIPKRPRRGGKRQEMAISSLFRPHFPGILTASRHPNH